MLTCPIDLGLVRPYNCVNQFLKINLFISLSIHPSLSVYLISYSSASLWNSEPGDNSVDIPKALIIIPQQQLHSSLEV